jgi:MFS family permease
MSAKTGGGAAATERPRSLWRHRDFLKLWTGDSISQLGTQVTVLALPLTAILVLKANAFQLGVLTAVEFLPFILIGLPAGVWVDRLPRRPILILGDLGRALVLGSIPIAYSLHRLHIVQLYAVAFLTGVFTVFFDVAYQSYLPSLVDRDQLVDGNAKLEISRSGAQLAGPGLAGALVQLLKAPVAIFVDSISYLWSAAWVFLIRRKEPPVEPAGPDGSRPTMRRQIGEGWRYVWHHPFLRPIAFCTANSNLFGSMMFAILVLFAVRQLGLSPGLIGLVFALGNVGFLAGAFTARRLAERLGVGPTIVGAAVLFGLGGVLIPLATRGIAIPVLVGGEALFGFGAVVYNINQVSLRQAITPHRMQGRMNATMRFMVWGTMPIGAFIGGVLGKGIGLRPTLWISAAGGLLSFLSPALSPVRSLQRIPDVGEDEQPQAEKIPARS